MSIDWTQISKKYKGKWIALKDDEITVLGVGLTSIQALEKAESKGCKKPILTKIPTKIIPYIGNGLSL